MLTIIYHYYAALSRVLCVFVSFAKTYINTSLDFKRFNGGFLKPPILKVMSIQKYYVYLSGETFLRKGSPPNPLPKTFNTNFSPIGCVLKKFEHHVRSDTHPMGLKFHTESFRKGV